MSLFPAYSTETARSSTFSKSDCSPKENESTSWLHNSSYTGRNPSHNVIDLSSESSDETVNDVSRSDKQTLRSNFTQEETEKLKHGRNRRREKRKHARGIEKLEYQREVDDVYFEDKYRDKGNNGVKTLCLRVRPCYNVAKCPLGFISYKQPKRNVYERYYKRNIDRLEKAKTADNVIKRESTTDSQEGKELSLQSINFEELQKNKTKEYNERLANEANNVKLWLEYIDFQDTLQYSQKYQTVKDVQRATTLKKLSIVEKAVEKNPESAELLRLKLFFMGELLPADEFSKQLDLLVTKDSGNIILWQEFIMTTQASVAMCTVPKVLDLYSRCFCILKHKARTNPRIYDERLLQMMYWCLTFLRHTGLWEQMWETIRMNLSLNLSLSKDSLSFKKTIDEKKLIGMEEVILMSRLPLNQLWQRTESLRENCHWITVNRDELEFVGDSRRFVLPDDVADFVHPILSRNLNFQMAIDALLLLKVPLLPTRNYALQMLSSKEFQWGVETSEVLLPFAYPAVGEITDHSERRKLLTGILEGRLTSGPQYLTFHPAQESYLDFIREVFFTIAENLPSVQRTSIYIWWLRFERMLIFLQKDDCLKHDVKGKKLRTMLKEFLKKEENRNNLHFYKEYALIEKEMGRFDNCVNILETAIQSQGACVSAISNVEEKAALFNLYRTFIETLLHSDTYENTNKARIMNVIKQMVPDLDKNESLPVEKYLEDCVRNFLQEVAVDDEKEMYFLPNLKCDTIVCYAYLLYMQDSNIDKIMNMFASCIKHYNGCSRIQEMLYEGQIILLQLHCTQTRQNSILKEVLDDALNLYPNNFFALSVLACIESKLPIWKFNTRKAKVDLWKAFATCLASRKRIRLLRELEDFDGMNAAINKLLYFHQTLARLPTTKCCPLLWRLYMLFLREHGLCEKKGEEVYHESVAQCPWARSVYTDAAEVAPQLLTQIQDVIREKELRMHVTPEELNILRG